MKPKHWKYLKMSLLSFIFRRLSFMFLSLFHFSYFFHFSFIFPVFIFPFCFPFFSFFLFSVVRADAKERKKSSNSSHCKNDEFLGRAGNGPFERWPHIHVFFFTFFFIFHFFFSFLFAKKSVSLNQEQEEAKHQKYHDHRSPHRNPNDNGQHMLKTEEVPPRRQTDRTNTRRVEPRQTGKTTTKRRARQQRARRRRRQASRQVGRQHPTPRTSALAQSPKHHSKANANVLQERSPLFSFVSPQT